MALHNLFKIHRLEQRTLVWWKNRENKIDFNPTYQRKGRRWSTSDKQYLIDSIINGFDIPKFYVADFVFFSSKLNENKKSYAVIDGKQRFEAIFEFFDDKFCLSQNFKLLGNKKIDLAGKKYSDLKREFPDVAEEFDNFNPDVIGVISDDVSHIEELFVRLNRSKPLSGAELRNAFSSPISERIRVIREHDFFVKCIKFNKNKGQDLNLAAKILMFEFSGIQETKKINLDKFTNQEIQDYSILESSVSKVINTLDLMSEMFWFEDPLLNTEGPIPVYYWLTKNSADDELPYIRDFIEEFHNFVKLKDYPEKTIRFLSFVDWSLYKSASRSINDRSSHELRYKILRNSFTDWNKYK